MHQNERQLDQQLDRGDRLDIANRDTADDLALVACPECGNVASIEWASWIGDALHVKVHCVDRHWFLMLAEQVHDYASGMPYNPIEAP